MKSSLMLAIALASPLASQGCSPCDPSVYSRSIPLAWSPPVIGYYAGITRNSLQHCRTNPIGDIAFVLISAHAQNRGSIAGACGDLMLADPIVFIPIWFNSDEWMTDRLIYYSSGFGPSITLQAQPLMCDWMGMPVIGQLSSFTITL